MLKLPEVVYWVNSLVPSLAISLPLTFTLANTPPPTKPPFLAKNKVDDELLLIEVLGNDLLPVPEQELKSGINKNKIKNFFKLDKV